MTPQAAPISAAPCFGQRRFVRGLQDRGHGVPVPLERIITRVTLTSGVKHRARYDFGGSPFTDLCDAPKPGGIIAMPAARRASSVS